MGKGKLRAFFKKNDRGKKILGGLSRFGAAIPVVGGVVSKGAEILRTSIENKNTKEVAQEFAGSIAETVDSTATRVQRKNTMPFAGGAEKVATRERVKKILGKVAIFGLVPLALIIGIVSMLRKKSNKKKGGLSRYKK
jgi:hypothetical protein